MNILKFLALIGAISVVFRTQAGRAEAGEIENQEPRLEDAAKKEFFEARLKEKYSLTSADLSRLHAQGMNDSQITIAAQLAKESGKSVDDIAKMRLDDKKGWGLIAKELGVSAREIGPSVASMHRQDQELKRERSERAVGRRGRGRD